MPNRLRHFSYRFISCKKPSRKKSGLCIREKRWTEVASMEWKHPSSPVRKKFKRTPSAGKVLLTVFWDNQGVLKVWKVFWKQCWSYRSRSTLFPYAEPWFIPGGLFEAYKVIWKMSQPILGTYVEKLRLIFNVSSYFLFFIHTSAHSLQGKLIFGLPLVF